MTSKLYRKETKMVQTSWLSQKELLVGRESRSIPTSLQIQQQQKHKTTNNGPTQTTLKATLHFGRRQAQMDPLRPICPKQKWFRSQGCFRSVFSPAATLTTKPDKLAPCPAVSYRSSILRLCASHLLTGLSSRCHATHPAPSSPTGPRPHPSPWDKHLCPRHHTGGSRKSEGFESMRPHSICGNHPNANS